MTQMMMIVLATPIMGKDLQPGDLFSTAGPEYWNEIERFPSIGERVYLRTNAPSSNASDAGEMVFKIEVARFDPDEVLKHLNAKGVSFSDTLDAYSFLAEVLFHRVDEGTRACAKKLAYKLMFGGGR